MCRVACNWKSNGRNARCNAWTRQEQESTKVQTLQQQERVNGSRSRVKGKAQQERGFQLPSIQVTWKSLSRFKLFEIPQERVEISTNQAKWRKGDFNTELDYSVPIVV